MNGKQHFRIGCAAGTCMAAYVIGAHINDLNATNLALSVSSGIITAYSSYGPDIDHNSTRQGRARKRLFSFLYRAFLLFGILLSVYALFLIRYPDRDNFHLYMNTRDLIRIPISFLLFWIFSTVIRRLSIYRWSIAHRGIMHTLLVPILFYSIYLTMGESALKALPLSVSVGWISHLIGDMCTVEGCPILFPLTRRNFRFPKALKSSNKKLNRRANHIALFLFCFAIAYLVYEFIGVFFVLAKIQIIA